MAVPDFQTLMLPLLKFASDGQQHSLKEAVEQLALEFQLSEEDQKEVNKKSGQNRLYNRVAWTKSYLKKAGLIQGDGRFQLTDRGREVLASKPTAINLAFLTSRFPEMGRRPSKKELVGDEPPATFNRADRTWNLRTGVEARILEKLNRSVPKELWRDAALQFFAFAIEIANKEHGDAWCVRETVQGIRLMTGRFLACEVSRSEQPLPSS